MSKTLILLEFTAPQLYANRYKIAYFAVNEQIIVIIANSSFMKMVFLHYIDYQINT